MQTISHKSRSASLPGQIITSVWFEITLINGTLKKWQRAQVGISKQTYSQDQNTIPHDSLTWQALQNYTSHAENAQWASLCCFPPQTLLFHSLVLCISELTSFYQNPAPCGISQPAGHRHVVLTQPQPASPENRRTNPGSFATFCLQETRLHSLLQRGLWKQTP